MDSSSAVLTTEEPSCVFMSVTRIFIVYLLIFCVSLTTRMLFLCYNTRRSGVHKSELNGRWQKYFAHLVLKGLKRVE